MLPKISRFGLAWRVIRIIAYSTNNTNKNLVLQRGDKTKRAFHSSAGDGSCSGADQPAQSSVVLKGSTGWLQETSITA